MKRADWVKVKAQATKANGNKPIKFAKDLGLGPALDAFHAADKTRSSLDPKKDPKAWILGTQKYLAARKQVGILAGTYEKQVATLQIADPAKRILRDALFGFLQPLTGPAGVNENKALLKRIEQVSDAVTQAAKAKREAERAR